MPEIPAPNLVALWAALDVVPTEDVPGWAAHWLVAGWDGADLRTLAGLDGRDAGEVRDVLEAALADCGASIPPPAVATATLSFTDLARMFADGRAGARWVAQKVAEVAAEAAPGVVAGLPLGRLTGESDEAEVARACADQLDAVVLPPGSLRPPGAAG